MNTIHKAQDRGRFDFGWLDTAHSFSFGSWYHPERLGFGALRVLNDDVVQPGEGFGTHPHRDMEIISIPLLGALAHKDSTGTEGIVRHGDVQVMSAGTGITHSEYNGSDHELLNFLQIWIFPDTNGVEPRYHDVTLPNMTPNEWQVMVGPKDSSEDTWIHQQAWISRIEFSGAVNVQYTPKSPGSHGVYFFVIEGFVNIDSVNLTRRDAIAVLNNGPIDMNPTKNGYLIAIEVPKGPHHA